MNGTAPGAAGLAHSAASQAAPAMGRSHRTRPVPPAPATSYQRGTGQDLEHLSANERTGDRYVATQAQDIDRQAGYHGRDDSPRQQACHGLTIAGISRRRKRAIPLHQGPGASPWSQ